jgi:hypothetical protein
VVAMADAMDSLELLENTFSGSSDLRKSIGKKRRTSRLT